MHDDFIFGEQFPELLGHVDLLPPYSERLRPRLLKLVEQDARFAPMESRLGTAPILVPTDARFRVLAACIVISEGSPPSIFQFSFSAHSGNCSGSFTWDGGITETFMERPTVAFLPGE